MSTSAQPSMKSFAEGWGDVLISTFIASIIYGITVLQTVFYYSHYAHDRKIYKVIVATIFVLDTSALALFMYCMYYYLVSSWGTPSMVAVDVKAFPIEYIITSVLVLIVQGFYINIIRELSAPIYVTIFLVALSVTALATSLMLPVIQLHLKYIQVIVYSHINHLAFNIARGTALGCDLGIVVALSWLLGMRKTRFKKTDNMINILIVISVQRGALQAIVQAGEVLAYAIKPGGIYFLPFHVIVSRIYCTSLLATLNARNYVAEKGGVQPSGQKRRDRRHTHTTHQPHTGDANHGRSAITRTTTGNVVLTSVMDRTYLSSDLRETFSRSLPSQNENDIGVRSTPVDSSGIGASSCIGTDIGTCSLSSNSSCSLGSRFCEKSPQPMKEMGSLAAAISGLKYRKDDEPDIETPGTQSSSERSNEGDAVCQLEGSSKNEPNAI